MAEIKTSNSTPNFILLYSFKEFAQKCEQTFFLQFIANFGGKRVKIG
jgi:hypothetical protein